MNIAKVIIWMGKQAYEGSTTSKSQKSSDSYHSKKEGKQKTSYSVNWDKLDYLKFHATYGKALENAQKDEEAFNSYILRLFNDP
jgi:hypothetical protein